MVIKPLITMRAMRRTKAECFYLHNAEVEEALSLPEIREGFLRSETALMQMVGRAARHADGAAIFYADRKTPAMQKCLDETAR